MFNYGSQALLGDFLMISTRP